MKGSVKNKILGVMTAVVIVTSACMSTSGEGEVMAEQPHVVREIVIEGLTTPEPTPYPDFDLEHLSIIRKCGEYEETNMETTATEEYSELDPEEQADDDATEAQTETQEPDNCGVERYSCIDGWDDGSVYVADNGSVCDSEQDKICENSEEGIADCTEPAAGPVLTYLGEWTTTAYCPCEICCGVYASGYTASGAPAVANHTVACEALPFGCQVMIDGQTYTVEDTGVSGEWIDIYFDDHDQALAYGMQTKSVYLVEG